MATLKDRRRVIKLMAATMAAYAVPQAALALGSVRRAGLHEWHGVALGAEVSLQLYHHDEQDARRIIQKSVKIIRDMENLFSLYEQNSVISRLNREGVVHNPPAEFVDLLRTAHRVSQMTSGAFDITVQPLWQYYKSRFSHQNRDYIWGPDDEFRTVQKLVGYDKLSISGDEISFDRPGMAVTLNGIAQGYVTDRVSEYLRSEGLTSVLVDIGEYRALGPQADRAPWRIGLMDPQRPDRISDILEISQGAVATSSGVGDTFDMTGDYHHLLDPHSGKSAHRYLSVTVTAPEATLADALSTAFCSMSEADIKKCLQTVPSVAARLTGKEGAVVIF